MDPVKCEQQGHDVLKVLEFRYLLYESFDSLKLMEFFQHYQLFIS